MKIKHSSFNIQLERPKNSRQVNRKFTQNIIVGGDGPRRHLDTRVVHVTNISQRSLQQVVPPRILKENYVIWTKGKPTSDGSSKEGVNWRSKRAPLNFSKTANSFISSGPGEHTKVLCTNKTTNLQPAHSSPPRSILRAQTYAPSPDLSREKFEGRANWKMG